MNEKTIKKRIIKIYNKSDLKFRANHFFQDFALYLPYTLGNPFNREDFIFVEPKDSFLLKLLRAKYFFNLNYELEQIIGHTVYNLMCFGTAYIYIKPEYELVEKENGESERIIKALELKELQGLITHTKDKSVEFCAIGYTGEVFKQNLDQDGLVILNLKDLGYSKRHFRKIASGIDKYDSSSNSLRLMDVEGYSFKEHSAHNNIKQLRVTRELGWMSLCNSLSDSHILYRRIKKSEFEMKILNFVIEKLNHQLSIILSDNESHLAVNYKVQNYKDLWEQFSEGKITISELSKQVR